MQVEKFIRRAQTFVGDEGEVDHVVVIQDRPIAALLGGAGAFFIVAILLNLIGLDNVILVGGLGGAALGVAMASLTKNYYLAGVNDEVKLLRLATWTGQPIAEVKSFARPIDAEVSKGLINKSLHLDGDKYILSRLFESEYDAISIPSS